MSPTLALPDWSFEPDSVLRYQLRGGGSPRSTHAELLLRTRASSGSLLSMTSRDANEYIVLEVSDMSTPHPTPSPDSLHTPGPTAPQNNRLPSAMLLKSIHYCITGLPLFVLMAVFNLKLISTTTVMHLA